MCEVCNGYGRSNCPVCGDEPIRCERCDGVGEILDRYVDDEGFEHEEWITCPVCGGNGYVEDDDPDYWDDDERYQLMHGK